MVLRRSDLGGETGPPLVLGLQGLCFVVLSCIDCTHVDQRVIVSFSEGMRSEFDPSDFLLAGGDEEGGDGAGAEPAGEPPTVAVQSKGKGRGRNASPGGNTGRGRGNAKWDYTGWEKWLTVDEDVNEVKDVANAKSRMRKAAAKSAFKAKKGTRWLLLVHACMS